MRYSGITQETRQALLKEIGVSHLKDLFSSIPAGARMNRRLQVKGPLPEAELLSELEAMKSPMPRISLVGAGLYHHFIPSTAETLFSRSEWVTSYTPYQPEISQGTLVMYYEFQTYVAMLTGQEIANSGLYDGSTAMVEAVLMARRIRPKAKVLYISEAVHPEYRAVLGTYLQFQDVTVKVLPFDSKTGQSSIDLSAAEQRDAIAIVLQTPNFFGVIEDFARLDPEAFRIAVITEAQSLALLPPPKADVVVGELQSLGIPMQLGGPTSGFFATAREHVRQMPGRLVGRTLDRHGQEAFCITLATREQFIRREKAVSNICTASGLMCLRAVLYLGLMGRKGLQDVARMSVRARIALQQAMAELGVPPAFSGVGFNEYVADLSARPTLAADLEKKGILLGTPLQRWFPSLSNKRLIALTEVHYPKMADIIQEVKSSAHHS